MELPAASAADRRALVVLAGVFLALAPVAVYARLGTVVLLVATLAAQPGSKGAVATLRGFSDNLLARLGAVLVAWAGVTLFWAPAPDAIALLRVAIVPVMGLLLVAAVRDLKPTTAARLVRLTVFSGLAMLALLALEVWSKGAILAFVVPDPGPIAPGQTPPIVEVSARGAAVLAPLTFVFAALIYGRARRTVPAVLFVAAALAVCVSSSMDAAWVAVAAGGLIFVLAQRAPRLTLGGFFAGLAIYAVLAPVISTSLLTLDGFANVTAQPWVGTLSRIGIWQEVARLIGEHPLLGHGFDATRALSTTAPTIPGTPLPALPLHAHNGILQIWLELGGVGIAVTVALLAAATRALWPMTARPAELALTLATVAATTVITLISFGIWQHWWLATWMLAAALVRLALREDASAAV